MTSYAIAMTVKNLAVYIFISGDPDTGTAHCSQGPDKPNIYYEIPYDIIQPCVYYCLLNKFNILPSLSANIDEFVPSYQK
jgi:hypothetical protein